MRLLIACLCLVLAPLGAVRAEGPALWTFSDEDTTVHLFGSIHLMKQGVPWFVDEVKAAYEAADTITFEVDTSKIDPAQAQALIQQKAFYGPDEKLSDSLSEETMEELLAAFDGLVPRAQLERFRPWFVLLQLSQVVLAKNGFLPQFGIDQVLLSRANTDGKEIRQLEDLAFQINMLSGIDREDQVVALNESLEDFEDLSSLFNDMVSQWLDEDLDGLDTLILQEFRTQAPDYYEAVFDDRNEKWVDPILALLDEPGTHLVVVGTGHLIGEGSVVDLLEERGISIDRD